MTRNFGNIKSLVRGTSRKKIKISRIQEMGKKGREPISPDCNFERTKIDGNLKLCKYVFHNV